MKYSIRFLLIVTALVALVAFLISLGMRSTARLENEDSQVIVAVLVCDFLDANSNQWPPEWTVLEPFFDARYPNGSQYSFDDLQTEVSIDFDIDGSKLLATCVNDELKKKFTPIRSLRQHLDSQNCDPNSIILAYVGRMITQ